MISYLVLMNAAYSFIRIRKIERVLLFVFFLLFAASQAVGQGLINFPYQGMQRFLSYNSIASEDYLRDSTYVFNEVDDSWLLKSKMVYDYDSQGNEISKLESAKEEHSWVNLTKIEKAYNSTQLLSYERTSIWNEDYDEWDFHERRDLFYNSINLLDQEIAHIRDGQLWKKDKKMEYGYSESYNIEHISKYRWQELVDEWVPTERTLFEYNQNEMLEREIIQFWNDSLDMWFNAISRDYRYDDSNNLVSTTRSNWSLTGQRWIGISMISVTYNEKGQIKATRQVDLGSSAEQNLTSQEVSYDNDGNLGETIISTWNPESDEWETVNKQVHFWSENLTGNLGSSSDNIDCVFMNPYFLGLNWKCSSLKDDVLYTVEVYDLWGRRFFANQFMGNRAFRIDGNIPPGVYTVVIKGGIDVHTEKVIIKG